MGSRSLSEMVKQVFGNEDMKAQFISDPNSVVAKFQLSKHEKEALFEAHASLKAGSSDVALMMEPMAMWP